MAPRRYDPNTTTTIRHSPPNNNNDNDIELRPVVTAGAINGTSEDDDNYDYYANNEANNNSNNMPNFASLPPTDGGKDAWLFVCACFLMEAMVWGFPLAFGVFESYYTSYPPFTSQHALIPAIGTTAAGIMYFAAPFTYYLLRTFPRIRRPGVYVGVAGMVLALVLASFANTVTQLLLTQGILYGCSGSLPYLTAILWLDEWFVRRKGLAYGVMWAGTGASGVVIPQALSWMLRTYGYRTALRASAVSIIVLSVPCLFFLKGRLPEQHSGGGGRRMDISFLKSTAFWCFQIPNIAQGLGTFLPTLYLPTYARSINLPSFTGTLALCLVNLATIAGAIITGGLIDYVHVTTAMMACAMGAAMSIFFFWGFAYAEAATPLLYMFALLYGVFGGGFSATWTGCAGVVRHRHRGVETGFVLALLAAGRGIGAVASGPLSARLLETDSWKGHVVGAYGSGFGSLVVFSGITAALGGLSWVGRVLGLL